MLLTVHAVQSTIVACVLAVALYVYKHYLATRLASLFYRKDSKTLEYEAMMREINDLKDQAKALDTMDTFTQCSLVRRKILVKEKELAQLAKSVPQNAFQSSWQYQLFVKYGPYFVPLLYFALLAPSAPLYEFHLTSDESGVATSKLDSILASILNWTADPRVWFCTVWASTRYVHQTLKSVLAE